MTPGIHKRLVRHAIERPIHLRLHASITEFNHPCTPGVNYTYHVSAVSDVFDALERSISLTCQPGEREPGTPINPTLFASGDADIVFTWDEPDDAGYPEFHAYRVRINGVDHTDVLRGTEHMVHDCTPGQSYSYDVVAFSSSYFSNVSAPISATCPQPPAENSPPTAPTNPRTTPEGGGVTLFEWDEPVDPGSPEFDTYHVFVNGTFIDSVSRWSFLPRQYKHFCTPGVQYSYEVQALNNSAGLAGPKTPTLIATCATALDASEPLNAGLVWFVGNLYFKWDEPYFPGSAPEFDSYWVLITGESGSNVSATFSVPRGTEYFQIPTGNGSCMSGLKYYFEVTAVRGSNPGPYSTEEVYAICPGAPWEVRSFRTASTGLLNNDVAWTRPIGEGKPPYQRYRIEVWYFDPLGNRLDEPTVFIGRDDEVNGVVAYSDSCFLGRTYHYRVRAERWNGNNPGPWSPELTEQCF
ncbi:MAG: fibronectin type III domain-containing protein [Actinomycetota bacterium]